MDYFSLGYKNYSKVTTGLNSFDVLCRYSVWDIEVDVSVGRSVDDEKTRRLEKWGQRTEGGRRRIDGGWGKAKSKAGPGPREGTTKLLTLFLAAFPFQLLLLLNFDRECQTDKSSRLLILTIDLNLALTFYVVLLHFLNFS